MKVLLFAIFSQLLDMVTTWFGLGRGLHETNSLLPRSVGGIIAIKLGLVLATIVMYLLTRFTGEQRAFNLLIGIPSLFVFYASMSNLSMEWK